MCATAELQITIIMFPNIFIETFGDGGPGEAYSSSDCCLDM